MALDDSMLWSFHNDLDRSGHLLRLIKDFRDFAALPVPEGTSEASAMWESAESLHSTASRIRTDLPVLAGSILLYVCGRFEYFVRELVMALGDEIAATSPDYDSLPDVVRSELWNKTLEIARNPQRYGHDTSTAEQLLVTLSRSFMPATAGASVQISSNLLAITEGNMRPRVLADVFKRVNIPSMWQEIGKQAAMKLQLGKPTDSECTHEAQARLDQMMTERNGIAHPTGATAFPDPDKVLSALEYLRVLSQVLVDLAKVPRPVVNKASVKKSEQGSG